MSTVTGVCLIDLYDHDDAYNDENKDHQNCGPDVEAAGSGAIVSGTLQISNHLPVSGLDREDESPQSEAAGVTV